MNKLNNLFSHIKSSWKIINKQQNFKCYPGSYGLMKVTVIGAAGKTGQPLCLMLKQSPLIDELNIYDVKSTESLGIDLNYIDTKCKVFSFSGRDNLSLALQNSKVVVIMAAAPDTDSVPTDKMWDSNSRVIKAIVNEITRCCPKALVAIATNPLNSIVPLASHILETSGCFNPNSLFGITSSNCIRANTFVAKSLKIKPELVTVPVIGGHSKETMIPVLSQSKPSAKFKNKKQMEDITANIRNSLSCPSNSEQGENFCCAFAAARLTISLVKAIQGYPDVVETAYVRSNECSDLKYLATPLLLGPQGIIKNLGIPKLRDFEKCMFNNALPILANDIARGEMRSEVYVPPSEISTSPATNMASCPKEWCSEKQ